MHQLSAEWRSLWVLGAWEKIKSRPARVRNPYFEVLPFFAIYFMAILSTPSSAGLGDEGTVVC